MELNSLNSHGGKRAGSGRKANSNGPKLKNLTARFTLDQMDWLLMQEDGGSPTLRMIVQAAMDKEREKPA